ncbi:unnamed protein product [Urochloa decumbens]|uniref:Uncharacterized protein n=1 Tax=Urochloa decumbens TaxID=240449 RepID=A0ABC8XV45_9POAL
MLRAGCCSSSNLKVTRCQRIPGHKAQSRARAVKVQSSLVDWKKKPLMRDMSNAVKSISSNLLQLLVDSAYRFSEQPVMNEGNFQPVSEIGEAVSLKDIEGNVPEDFPEADGQRLLHKVDLKFEEGKFIHDIGVTTKYTIIMDYPLRFGISRTFLQKPIFENDMNGKSRIGVMPRFGNVESIRWFDVENHCSFHLFNCFEDKNEVVVRGCRTLGSVIPGPPHNVDKSNWYGRVFFPPDKNSEDFDPSLDGILFSRPYEWRLNLESGIASEGYITSDDVAMDFPVINENFTGTRNKYGYTQVVDSVETSITVCIFDAGLFKYKMIAKLHFDIPDKENKFISVEYHALQEKQFCSGVQFVAKRNGRDEDDGWVITYLPDSMPIN